MRRARAASRRATGRKRGHDHHRRLQLPRADRAWNSPQGAAPGRGRADGAPCGGTISGAVRLGVTLSWAHPEFVSKESLTRTVPTPVSRRIAAGSSENLGGGAPDCWRVIGKDDGRSPVVIREVFTFSITGIVAAAAAPLGQRRRFKNRRRGEGPTKGAARRCTRVVPDTPRP